MKTIYWKLLNPWRNNYSLYPIIKKELVESFEDWSKYFELKFIEKTTEETIEDVSNPNILYIGFYKGEHNCSAKFDGKGKILAHGTFINTGKSSVIHFDDDENWIFGYSKKSYLENLFNEYPIFSITAKHEIGHILGLGHSTDTNSIMYYKYNKFITNVTTVDVEKLSTILTKKQNAPKAQDYSHLNLFLKEYSIHIFLFIILILLSYKTSRLYYKNYN